MQVPTESSSTRRTKRDLIFQRQQDRKENEGSNCFMCFGVRTHRKHNQRQVWDMKTRYNFLCSQSCTPYDSGQTQLKLKTTSDRKFYLCITRHLFFNHFLRLSSIIDACKEISFWNMRRDDVTSHMSLAEEQLRAFLDDFQFKDIPDLADSSSLIGSTSWKKTSEFSLN